MFQIQIPSLRPMTTAHLAQTMTLLSMTSVELAQKIEAELANNPALELVEERRCPSCGRVLRDPGPCPICSRPHGDSSSPIVFVSARSDFYQPGAGPMSGHGQDLVPDEYMSASEDLPTYILRQIAPELQPTERNIAAHILTSLNEDGLLSIPIEEISHYQHVPAERVIEVVRLIQRADPLGCGSENVQQALLAQIEILSETRPVPELARAAIEQGFKHLSRRQYSELANILQISRSEAEGIAQFISDNLYPFPARAHWGDIRHGEESAPAVYHQPDIVISRLKSQTGSPLVVEILMPLYGTLQVNPAFQKEISRIHDELKEKWKLSLEQANLLIKCIQQRNNIVQRLLEYLAIHQRDFILNGDQYLKPLTRAQVAETLEVHESTISRAVSSKTAQLPSGRIVPLEMFFDRSLHIRATLRSIIAQENRALTDTQLANLLAKQGYPIARRTVAKYRAMEGILPANLRRTTPA
ncbi:MAG: hypothetical protein JXB38_10445 [Anaerolineales bacterium]|nr:hypothetical protein [Anaerolineales bacterium]